MESRILQIDDTVSVLIPLLSLYYVESGVSSQIHQKYLLQPSIYPIVFLF